MIKPEATALLLEARTPRSEAGGLQMEACVLQMEARPLELGGRVPQPEATLLQLEAAALQSEGITKLQEDKTSQMGQKKGEA